MFKSNGHAPNKNIEGAEPGDSLDAEICVKRASTIMGRSVRWIYSEMLAGRAPPSFTRRKRRYWIKRDVIAWREQFLAYRDPV